VELKENKVMRLKEFRINIAIALSSKNRPKVGRKSKEMCIPENTKIKKKIVPRPIDDVRLDCHDHIPIVGIKECARLVKQHFHVTSVIRGCASHQQEIVLKYFINKNKLNT